MPTIQITETVPDATGTEKPASGTITFIPTGTRFDGTDQVNPAAFTITLDAAGKAAVGLDPTGPHWCWRAVLDLLGAPQREEYVTVKPADTQWANLSRIDPETIPGDGQPEPAWWGMAASTVTAGTVDAQGHLQLTRTDGSNLDAGLVRGPKGDKGDQGPKGDEGLPGVGIPGPANTLAVGTVTTGAPGTAAAATITGSAPNQTLGLTIPRGDVGPTGPANTLAIGAVTTGAAGSAAAAAITGAAPNQTLSLTIPQGAQGVQGPPLDITVRPVNAKLDYGAKGDGTTDDTAALQAFITYCQTNSRWGYIPAGTYKVTSTLNFSARPNWRITGAGKEITRIVMATDNVAILNLGSDTASYLHDVEISNLALDYTNAQTGNTSANPILFSQMAYESKFESIGFDGGYYAIRVANGIGGPWGCTWDNLQFGGNLRAGAMDWSQCANAVPNNRFGRMFVTATNMTGSPALAIFDVRGYNFTVDTIEIIDVQGSKTLFRTAAGSRVEIGTIKLENGTYNTANSMYLLDFGNGAGSWATIGHFTMGGNNMVVTNNTTLYAIRNSSEGVECDFMDIGTTAALPGGSSLYAVSSSDYVSFGNVKSSSGFWTGLQNNGSSTSANFVKVRKHLNDRLSDNKGDADYTVALGDPNIISYETTLTAPRTVNLPSDNTKLFNGLYYEVRGYGAVNGANTITVKNGATVLATISADKVVYRWTWRRVPTGNGWVLTRYQTLP